jgi:hypothetical protein
MKTTFSRTTLFLLVFLLCQSLLVAQTLPQTELLPTQATVNLPIEIRLLSQKQYAHPIKDVQIRATFTHTQTRRSITLFGFWNGDGANIGANASAVYCVRFAPALEGEWTYRIISTDTTNTALHNRTGKFISQKIASANPISTNPLVQHGFVRVAENRRTLAYADSTPFFWLGDTAWGLPENSTRDEALRFLDDRARKGFTVVQVAFASASFFATFGNRNRAGETLYLREDRSLYNPRFFDYADSLVTWANARGITLAIMPQFATGLIEGYDRGWVKGKLLTRDEALIGVRYVAARYAGHSVVWICGGDVRYDLAQDRAYWETFGRELRTANGAQHILSIHPEGLSASYDFFENAGSWLDFHMVQTSHQPWSDLRTQIMRRGYVKSPPMPILNAEPPYEGILLNFFVSDIEASFLGGKYAATDEDTRLAAYMSIFSGGLVGITYGANGIFQWNSATKPDKSFDPLYNTDQALNLPGATQYSILKNLLTGLKWQDMVPRTDVVVNITAEQGIAPFTGVIASSNGLCLYASKGMRSCEILCGSVRGEGGFEVKWISPVTGMIATSTVLPFTLRPLLLTSPDAKKDWLLTVQRTSGFVSRQLPDSGVVRLTRFVADKSTGGVELAFSVPESGTLDIDICDVRGASVLRQTLQASRGEAYFALPISASGAYLYRVRFQSEKMHTLLTGKFVQE